MDKKEKADELIIANEEKTKREAELIIANKELAFQNDEKGKRAEELIIANKELAYQNKEKEKRAEEYRDIYDNAIEGMFRTSLEGKIIQSNKALAKMLGYDTADNVINSVIDIGHQVWANADERIKYTEILEKQDILQKYECQIKRVDGEIIWVSLNTKVVRDENSKALYYEGFVEDITKRKQVEETLKISKERLQFATEGANLGIWNWNTVTGELIFSNLCKELFGIGLDETVSYQRFSDVLHPDDRERTDKAIKDALDNHKDYDIEYRILWPDESIHWLAAKGRGYYDATGKDLRFEGVVQDITERKQAEKTLQESEERFRSLYENSTVGIYRTTPDGKIILANPTLVKLLGYSSFEELAGRNLAEDGFEPSYERTYFIDIMKREGWVKGLESAWTRMDGTTLFISESARAINDKEGKIIYYDGIVEDITLRKKAERELITANKELAFQNDEKVKRVLYEHELEIKIKSMQAEEALIKSEIKYKDLINEVSDGYFVTNNQGIITFANISLAKIFGFISPEEMTGHLFTEFNKKNDTQDVSYNFKNIIKNKKSVNGLEMEVFRVDRNPIHIEIKAVPVLEDGKVVGMQGVIRDITERKKAEQELLIANKELIFQITERKLVEDALRESEESYRKLFEDHSAVKIILDPDTGAILDANDAAAQYYGWTREELKHMKIYQINTLSPKEANVQMERTRSENLTRFEFRHRRADGSIRDVEVFGSKIEIRGKDVLHSIIRDITERKIAEQLLKVSEEKYRTMLIFSPDGILLIDLKGIITEVSDIGIQLFGADTSGDLVGKNIQQFIAPGEKKNFIGILKKTLNEGLVQNYELVIKKKNKDLIAGVISITLIQQHDGAPASYMIIARDISQRKKAETKHMHADRMVNLGEMASGIAHEINQPLNIISMVMDKILFESSKTNSVDIEFLKIKSDRIFENISRIKNIIDHIRAFSRSHDDYVLTLFDINSSIENAVSMILEQFKHLGIELDLQPGKQIPQIIGNTYKFEQVILNILVNAKDAVLEKKSKKPDYTEMIIGIRSYHENQFIVVEINDNGIGISDNDINNIMLPFYTSKEEGKGTGLGLSICYQIIKEMNGTIDIKSKSFIGTKIKIVLDIQKNK